MPNLNDMNLKMFVAAIAVVCGMVSVSYTHLRAHET